MHTHTTDDRNRDATTQTVATPAPAMAPPTSSALSALRRVAAALRTLSAVSLSALLGPLALAALLWGFWAWTGSAGSLGTALNLLHWALPSDQQLHSADVQGNLRQGGRIGQINWQSDGLQVQGQEARLVLDWSQLWRQAWPVQSIQIQSLLVQDQRPPKPTTPLSDLRLPLPLQLSLQVDQLIWQGNKAVTLSDLRAHYAYDGQEHRLNIDSLVLAQSRYTLQAHLQGAAPMALNITAQGQVQTPASGRTPALQLQVQSTIQGQLTGPQAQLSVEAELIPAPGQGALSRAQDKVHLALQAQIQPWQEQSVLQAQGQWQALDLAPLWPGAPQTRLRGQAQLLPDGTAWQLDAQLENLLPGAWNLQRLPLAQLKLKARHVQGLWQIQQAQASMAAGQLEGKGQQTPLGWTGQLEIQNLQPGLMHSAWSGPAVQGRLKAEASGTDTIALSADLQAQKAQPPSPARPTGSTSWSWEQVQLTGKWRPDRWDVNSLRLQAEKALLEAQFTWQPAQKAVEGRMTMQIPGMQATAQGNLAPMKGQGSMDVQMQDAARSQSWLQSLPGWGDQLKAFKASGTAQLQAQWQGGFAQADAPLSLKLQWPRIEWAQSRPASASASGSTTRPEPWYLATGQLNLQGTPLALQAEIQARLGQGSHLAQLQTTWRASRDDVRSPGWQGRIDQFDLSTPNTQTPSAAPWRLTLQPSLTWQGQLAPVALTWGPSSWRLQGPGPGNPRLQVEAGAWTAPAQGQPLQTHGALQWSDLPAYWAYQWLGTDILNEITLQGQGQWRMDQNLNLSLSAERHKGDVRVKTDSASGQTTAAGLRQATFFLNIQNEQLQAELNWDSAQMGQAQATLQSQLNRTPDGWQWAEQAPLRGSVQASLPQIGAWSVLAPPGWRVQGTLDASFNLGGTRSQPQWQGRLRADQLAAKSAVQGLEFSQGQMQALLQDQSLILESLSLRGAGTQGGELQARGQIQFNANANTTPPGSPRSNPLRWADMALQIEAKNLRVSNRADRRLSISGNVKASTAQGQFQLRGGLKADQALFILPDDSTPSLGGDVVVFRPGMSELDLSALSTPPNLNDPSGSWLGVPDVRVMLDLGNDFQLQGHGIHTRLNGQLELLSNVTSKGLPRLSGLVRTDGGRYKAYGQQLNIDTGVLRFSGPYDNPSLDIIALRPNLTQKVGVQITGTALLPRIRLYADPDLPDADKLAWLVLGRSAANGGAESAVLQQAAVALFSGNGKTFSGELASNLGLDEISLASGSRSDATATGAALTFGKRLSKDFYLAYETSLSGAFGSLYIFYDLSRRLTLRAQAGEQSALDLIFTVRRD